MRDHIRIKGIAERRISLRIAYAFRISVGNALQSFTFDRGELADVIPIFFKPKAEIIMIPTRTCERWGLFIVQVPRIFTARPADEIQPRLCSSRAAESLQCDRLPVDEVHAPTHAVPNLPDLYRLIGNHLPGGMAEVIPRILF